MVLIRSLPQYGRKVVSMKKMILLIFLFLAGWISFPNLVQADMEWRILKDLNLQATPLDVTPSADGQWLFILTPGEILVYSFQEGKITDRISVDKGFDRIASLPRANALTLTSSTKKELRIILLEVVHKIDVTGLTFKGPQNAPVTIAVFTDYQ